MLTRLHRLELAGHVLKEQQRAVIDAREALASRAVNSRLNCQALRMFVFWHTANVHLNETLVRMEYKLSNRRCCLRPRGYFARPPGSVVTVKRSVVGLP